MKIDKHIDIVALGESMIEFNQRLNQPADSPPCYIQGFGGDTSNAAIAAARAGAVTTYLTRLGTDRWGDRLMDLWKSEGVDTAAVVRDPQAPTGLYFVSHDAQGHHFNYARAGSAASCMQPHEVALQWATPIAQSHWLHISGISMAISASACDTVFAAMAHARNNATKVAFDSNLRLSLWPLTRALACTRQAIALCDLFLPSLEDITAMTGLTDANTIIDWSHAQGARQVVLKLGAQGAIVSDGVKRQTIAGRRVQAIDATGAGDCFAGNVLARLSAGDDLWTAAVYANVAASLSVQGLGAVAPLPRKAEVLQALHE